jgi:hypothetical protein
VAIPTVAAETSESTPEAETDAPVAPIASAQAPPPDAAEAPKRVFKFSRLERAI